MYLCVVSMWNRFVIVCAIIAYFVLLSLDLLACAHRPSIDLYLIKYYYLWLGRGKGRPKVIIFI